MAWQDVVSTVGPRDVEADGRRFIVALPGWFAWQGALERAVLPGGAVDAQRLLEECLLTCVRTADGQALTRHDLGDLSVQAGDQLVGVVTELMEAQGVALDLHTEEGSGAGVVRGRGFTLGLRPWTFGERNDALRRTLHLQGGDVALDLAAYELTMVLTCVSTGEGERLAPAEVAHWPVPLGEAVLRLLDRLNGTAPQEADVLAACLQSGQDHPDLTLLQLCQAFGWSPADVERMDARTAERLYRSWRVLQGSQPPAPSPAMASGLAAASPVRGAPVQTAAAAGVEEGVTRILVQDH